MGGALPLGRVYSREGYWAQHSIKNIVYTLGLFALAALLLLPAAPAQAQAAGPFPTGAQDLSGVWWTRSYNPRILPEDGSDLLFTAEGEERYRHNVDRLRAGDLEDHSRVWCSPDGVPRIWAQPYPFRIIQTPGQTTILYERNGVYRLVQMDTPVPDAFDLFPYFMGNSYGHWEGDTLVIEAVGFKARTTFTDDTGVPQSDQLHVIERLRKIGDDQLEVVVTIEDPVVFSRPWDARFLFERRDDIQHFEIWVCGEDHRDVSEVKGVLQ